MTDYRFDGVETWWPWLKSEEITFNDTKNISNALIPTKESNTMLYWLNLAVKISLPIVLIGDASTGKSITLRHFLREIPKEKFINSVLNLAANIKPQNVQNIIMGKLDRRRKGVFGPPVGKLVSFCYPFCHIFYIFSFAFFISIFGFRASFAPTIFHYQYVMNTVHNLQLN